MQEAIGHLGHALDHLHEAQKLLDDTRQTTLIIQARTLTAVSGATIKNARKRLQQAEEETCEKS